jgi:chitodextrinase
MRFAILLALMSVSAAAQSVYVSRFWHNHQPIYWPEWNGNGSQTQRIQHAWDSIVLKGGQTYGTGAGHPDNNLTDIFGLPDRQSAYQSGPRNSLANLSTSAGFAMSYSGSLIDNIRSLGAQNQLGYGSGWWNGNSEARGRTTPSGSRRMELVGFTYHHSLAPLLPKAVFRKEMQIFKQAWWKAWGGNMNLSDHSKGFFPTEMAFTSELIDVLADEGYQWAIVASHHLSRTCPTYNDRANPTGTFQIKSSPPNKADQLGPSPTGGWWFNEPNPGQAAWNVTPHAYQLHRIKYVNPSTGAEKSIIAVPSDDALSYVAGYSGAQIGMVSGNIAPGGTSERPVIALPSTDGDNAWGGGSSSYFESTPAFFSAAQSSGYQVCAIQDLVNAKPPPAGQFAHIEDGAWIFPESDYGSPYFLKWIEPPVGSTTSTTKVPGTVIDMETPGFALKFWSWAPVITGANWCETAEQVWKDEAAGNAVNAWKIQDPYDNLNGGNWSNPNDVELAWHIYLGGLDSGFNYYGGLGNDDEVKQSLATRRAIEKLTPWFTQSRRDHDRTAPSVLRPQRFPWNPGAYTFGWFNSIPGGNTSYLKKMPSEFYIWTHAYDLSGISSISVKVRLDGDGVNTMANNQNETYAGGGDVGTWITLPMTKRVLPNSRAALNAAANNGQIDYFITPPELADYYFAKITSANVPGFKNKLLDYFIEATDSKGNTHQSEIQHVWVADDGAATTPPSKPTGLNVSATSSTQISLTWTATPDATSYLVRRDGIQIATPTTNSLVSSGLTPSTTYSYTVIAVNSAGNSPESDPVSATTQAPPPAPATPGGLTATAVSSTQINVSWSASANATSYVLKRNGSSIATQAGTSFADNGRSPDTSYSYTIAASNSSGTSADSAAVNATTPAAPVNFVMDGTADSVGYLVAQNGMTLFAALRGSRLYVGTWSTGNNTGGANDHFVHVSDSVLASATTATPWAKAGLIAIPAGKPFLAAESTNNYVGWQNAGSATVTAFKAATSSGQMEGSIDLTQAFGSLPGSVYLASVAYGTADAGVIGSQCPAGNGNNNLEPGEFLQFPVQTVTDTNADGKLDHLDPEVGFKITQLTGTGPASLDLTWPTVPGKSYEVQNSDDFLTWQTVSGSSHTATSGSASHTLTLSSQGATKRFYRVRLLP